MTTKKLNPIFEGVDLIAITFDELDAPCQQLVQERLSVVWSMPSGNCMTRLCAMSIETQAKVIASCAEIISFDELKAAVKSIEHQVFRDGQKAAAEPAKSPRTRSAR